MKTDYDILVIGGGINGAGVSREAAGRGLSVMLCEAQDLASATSSSSTKLIHGGLRYLEQYEFKLVREALKEREILVRMAPHVIWPLRFILPHVEGLRPRWMIRLGLFLYDHLGGRRRLQQSCAVDLQDGLEGRPLKEALKDGYSYADCWAEDARLVVLNAMDAKERGADILTRTPCMSLRVENGIWTAVLKNLESGDEFSVTARCVVNAAGPWVRHVIDSSNLASHETPNVKLVQGSHLVFPQLYEGTHAYILQQPDRRIIFAIPFEGSFTLVGTTDTPFEGDPAAAAITLIEENYLCDCLNRFFSKSVTPQDAVWSYSGVRPLFDDGEGKAQEVTRDYHLDLNLSHGAPLLSVFGGKITTFRHLSHAAVNLVTGKKIKDWTRKQPLPGGDMPGADFDAFVADRQSYYGFLSPNLIYRYARAYGTRLNILLDGVDDVTALGKNFGAGLYEKEIFYLIRHEFARTADDILRRRSRLGLHLPEDARRLLESAMPLYRQQCGMM